MAFGVDQKFLGPSRRERRESCRSMQPPESDAGRGARLRWNVINVVVEREGLVGFWWRVPLAVGRCRPFSA